MIFPYILCKSSKSGLFLEAILDLDGAELGPQFWQQFGVSSDDGLLLHLTIRELA
jgi:hypothetical protein